ncbi:MULTISPECIES: ABC transporter permease subunit [Paenibacillus]|uniref:Sugar ABC transporter permease n=1 Tax=Paenibacillus glycanilyticus TaxID=126569 RepID=A0ABQ6NM39_9BACL|nr:MULTISPECIES: ABC transporter permease subunit [Paenibacillus]MCK9859975.1 ABC transporter permease subunit [Paenibacillus sp. ATY16]NIK70761.1 putative aldouronate transport system permease protein [Paenibacillus sp. BK720]TCM93267.1 carbohydrate ABC transporter membrane protein 1 (CUT1 family) [Paenibacillus sp. BK033]GMK45074.1 sugar ABC transporter permease [Paenibacillus glycanilyticus]
MAKPVDTIAVEAAIQPKKTRKSKRFKNQGQLMWMSLPVLIYVMLFSYYPIWGWTMAFQNYKPAKSFGEQEWVGLKQFKFLFTDDSFLRVLRNTIGMSAINMVLGFVTAIVFAILLNEVKNKLFKRSIQTISYLPHFLSWIIVTGIVATSLSVDGGIVNEVLMKLGIIHEPIMWLSEPKYFWGIVGASHVWKEVGWNAIIYLAAITSIDPSLYEAAEIDGANRYHKMWYITLPGIKSIVIILLIMNLGWILEAGFEVQYLLGNGVVVDWSETIDIFVLKYGLKQGNYSLATAAGIFKTVVSITLIYAANTIAKRFGEERLI